MQKTIGFIGSGNMGGAILGGILQAGLVPASAVLASDVSEAALQKLQQAYGIRTSRDNRTVAAGADILFLAVKPHLYPAVIREIRDSVRPDAVVVAIAAGQRLAAMEELFGRRVKLARTMPNTPALVGEGMTAVCPNAQLAPEDTQAVLDIFSSLGRAEITTESMMDVVTGISGSSPAYVYQFIEALSDAAVAEGMPRDQSYRFAAQAVLGAAKMVLETGLHPGVLKDQVCSPGGTTIAAVCELENRGFRSAVIGGVKACVEKSRDMSR